MAEVLQPGRGTGLRAAWVDHRDDRGRHGAAGVRHELVGVDHCGGRGRHGAVGDTHELVEVDHEARGVREQAGGFHGSGLHVVAALEHRGHGSRLAEGEGRADQRTG